MKNFDTLLNKKAGPLSSHDSCILLPTELMTLNRKKETMYNINNALAELPVLDANSSNFDPNTICAVGSDVLVIPTGGESTQTDVSCFWCNFCNYTTQVKADLVEHGMTHRFHCKNCSYESFSRASVIYHCVQEHESFYETAMTLKYCSYGVDVLSNNGPKKCNSTEMSDNVSPFKRAKVDNCLDIDNDTVKLDGTDAENHGTDAKSKQQSDEKIPPEHMACEEVNQPQVESSLPVISSVIRGQQAVMAVMNTVPDQNNNKPARREAVSQKNIQAISTLWNDNSNSGFGNVNTVVETKLCWSCGYCKFLTLSQDFLKVHLSHNHPGKIPKHVALLVSSEEVKRLRQSEAQYATTLDPVRSTSSDLQKMSDAKSPMTKQTAKESAVPTYISRVLEPAKTEATKESTPDMIEHSKVHIEHKLESTIKCAHCNFNDYHLGNVKSHMLDRHFGNVMYALDMKAVKSWNKRYVYFCLNANCSFNTKEDGEYYAHIDVCMPWQNGGETRDINPGIIKSMQLTKNFIGKIVKSIEPERVMPKDTAHGCVYCDHACDSVIKLKKHTITHHPDKSGTLKVMVAGKREIVNFCKFCLFETCDLAEFNTHMKEKHKPVEIVNDEVDNTASSTTVSSSSDSADQALDVYEVYKEYIVRRDYDKALLDYMRVKDGQKKKRGRISAQTYAQCKKKILYSELPPLLKCCHCMFICFGGEIMSEHLQGKHRRLLLHAIDIQKIKSSGLGRNLLFCPADQCHFYNTDPKEVIKHATNEHSINLSDKNLKCLNKEVRGLKFNKEMTGET